MKKIWNILKYPFSSGFKKLFKRNHIIINYNKTIKYIYVKLKLYNYNNKEQSKI